MSNAVWLAGNELQSGDPVLIWGGSGRLGSQAVQLAKSNGAMPIAVVSDAERGKYAGDHGAVGWINRQDFDHWGRPARVTDVAGQKEWIASARSFGKAVWNILGERRDPAIVFEHPGEATIRTSIFVCRPGGMVVVCAGTTGYDAVVDLRYHWTRQTRLQGSHGTNDCQAKADNDLILAGKVQPSLGRVVEFDAIDTAHGEMSRGEEVFGNIVALVGAERPGLGAESQ